MESVMELKMFTREGSAYNGAVARDGKGRPAFSRLKTCGRCGGQGGSEAWKMTGWTCYDCGGKGTLGWEVVRLYGAEELAKLNATREKRRSKKEAARVAKAEAAKAEADAKRAEFEAANAEVVAGARKYAERSPFFADLLEKLEKYGSWSDKQVAAVAKSVAEIEANAVKSAASKFVGEVGKRMEMKVTVERVASYVRPSFGYSRSGMETVWIVSMRDEAGNAIVVKSPSFYGREKGEKLTLRATVKEHSEYRGEKQTVMQRAAVLESELTVKEAT
jgi:hypothetical protein